MKTNLKLLLTLMITSACSFASVQWIIEVENKSNPQLPTSKFTISEYSPDGTKGYNYCFKDIDDKGGIVRTNYSNEPDGKITIETDESHNFGDLSTCDPAKGTKELTFYINGVPVKLFSSYFTTSPWAEKVNQKPRYRTITTYRSSEGIKKTKTYDKPFKIADAPVDVVTIGNSNSTAPSDSIVKVKLSYAEDVQPPFTDPRSYKGITITTGKERKSSNESKEADKALINENGKHYIHKSVHVEKTCVIVDNPKIVGIATKQDFNNCTNW